jgi:hypothetical protein
LLVRLDRSPRRVLHARQHKIRNRSTLQGGSALNKRLLFRRHPRLQSLGPGPPASRFRSCFCHDTSRIQNVRPMPGQFKSTPFASTQPHIRLPSLHPHSHSIVLSDGSALISQRKFFQRARKNRLPDPSEICALDFKREFRRLGICSISATIGIN